jgi:hypothetical protein
MWDMEIESDEPIISLGTVQYRVMKRSTSGINKESIDHYSARLDKNLLSLLRSSDEMSINLTPDR